MVIASKSVRRPGKWPLLVVVVVLVAIAGGAAAWYLALWRPSALDAEACRVARQAKSKQGWQVYLKQQPEGACEEEGWKQLAAIASAERQRRARIESEKRAAEEKLIIQARKEADRLAAENEKQPTGEEGEKPAPKKENRPVKIVKIKQPGKKLFWLRCPLGQSRTGSVCEGQAMEMTWKEALKACPKGFRLPVREEIVSLLGGCNSDVQQEKYGNCNKCEESKVCSSIFGKDGGRYWSSDVYAHSEKFAWIAFFKSGIVIYDFKTNLNYVRCLQAGR
ncbi:MAG TPA: hypothetical protein VM425_15865 [Myxococcota bacterium]|nr:hypothetical protein [Myxococcota bacterium]